MAWLRLNRTEKRNAMDRPLRSTLLEAIADVSENPDARVAVITGNGTAFSSGTDLTQEGGPVEIPPEHASFWEVFVRRGLPLEGGGAWLLTRSLSLARA